MYMYSPLKPKLTFFLLVFFNSCFFLEISCNPSRLQDFESGIACVGAMSALNSDDLNRIFDRLDLDGDGFVSIDELKWLLERIGVNGCQEELASLVGKPNLDRIDFVLFYDSIIIRRGSEEGEEGAGEDDDDCVESDLAKAFRVYDLNGDGYISCEELQSVLSRLGLWNEHCGNDCRSMISKFDTNSDGVLDFEEFKNMMFLS